MSKEAKVRIGELVSADLTTLRECEHIIETAENDAYSALKRIHDEALYKADKFATFDDYVKQRWGHSKTRAYQLLDHVRLVEHMKADGVTTLPQSEAHTRPLLKLRRVSKSEDAFFQSATLGWRMAVDTAPKADIDTPRITQQHVESTMQHFGLYRNAKRSEDAAAVTELRTALTKLLQCEALKSTATQFIDKHGDKAFPNHFLSVVDWLNECAEALQTRG